MRNLDSTRMTGSQNATPARSDRRRDARTRSCRPVHVRPADPLAEFFEDVRTMNDFSRNGFYFITKRPDYSKGMRLCVTPGLGLASLKYLGEVVRFERLATGWYGVGVRLLRVQDLQANSSN
jgi:hypothetical protein